MAGSRSRDVARASARDLESTHHPRNSIMTPSRSSLPLLLLISALGVVGFTLPQAPLSSAPDGAASPALASYGTASEERHVCITFPVPRVGANCTARSPQKVGPCGVAGRSENVNEFRPGETITVQFNETVNHPSHYRISFNPNGDAFPDPTSVDDKSGGPLVLFDGIEDEEAAAQEIRITFPDVECDSCTLQLIQVMYDKGGNGFGGRTAEGGNDDIYYSCADIVLRRR
jgi:hypothetical protein